MWETNRSPVTRYGSAILLTAVAILVRLALAPVLEGRSPFLVFTLSVAAAAWLGGTGPGLLSTLLGSLAGTRLFLAPLHGYLPAAPADRWSLLLFVLVGILFSLLGGSLQWEMRRKQESSRFLSSLLDNAPTPIFVLSRDGHFRMVNKAFEEVSGLKPGDLIGKNCMQVWSGETARQFNEYNRRVLEQGESILIEQFADTPEGKRCFQTAEFPLRNATGAVDALCGIYVDITAQRRFQDELHLSEERFSKAFASNPLPMTITDHETGRFLDVNESFLQATGYSREEIIGRSTMEVEIWGDPGDRARMIELLRKNGSVRNQELLMRPKTKKTSTCLWSAEMIVIGGRRCILVTVIDISARKQAEEELRLSEERFRLAVDSMPGTIIIYDADLHVEFVNGHSARLAGRPASELIGHCDTDILPPEVAASYLPALMKAAQTRTPQEVEVTVGEGSDQTIISGSFIPLLDEKGSIRQIMAIGNDITERRIAERERERLLEREKAAREAAEAANRAKDEFLATVSHELRTPLNSMLGWASMLRSGRLPPDAVSRAIEVIERSARAQTQLVEDILDVSRIVSGRMSLRLKPTDLISVIKSAVDTARPAALARDISLQMTLDASTGKIEADPDRLRQAVWNLLSNAIKFTPEKGHIEVKLERENCHALLSVTDNGEGISPDFIPYVFERFRQADSSTTRQHGGLGLGLSIVRHLVELHGGTVEAYSAGPGQGARFTIRLPIRPAAPAPVNYLPQMSLRQGPDDPASLKVLFVDDDAETREIVGMILEQNGMRVRVCSSAIEALAAAPEFMPDVLVSDIAMPEVDGYALLSRLRSFSPGMGGEVPAVALTAYARNADLEKALSAGFEVFVPKPVDPARLLEAVTRAGRKGK